MIKKIKRSSFKKATPEIKVTVLQVLIAEPYRPGQMGAKGRANGMLIRQDKFPLSFIEGMDILKSWDSDRCYTNDLDHTVGCFVQYAHGEENFEAWAQVAPHDDVLRFVRDITKADRQVAWTGFRILGTVDRTTDHPVWTFQLFARHENAGFMVYSGPGSPNVLPRPRR